jgi:hypothetical protein
MLANSQNFIFQKLNGFFPTQDHGLALVHYHKALRHASEIMKDLQTWNNEEVIVAAGSFMCHHVSYINPIKMVPSLTHLRPCSAAFQEMTGTSIGMPF